ncbi:MAG: formylglycine-generating enzyme family protein [Planctomycetes bacterium]|nr:formylglycine-generating enzyme family protein [Planctomycetota bacterium]
MKAMLGSIIVPIVLGISMAQTVIASNFAELKSGQESAKSVDNEGEKPQSHIDTDSSLDFEFVLVKGGCFKMGDDEIDAKPVHEVCLDDFYISKYEVTQGQWKNVMGSNPSHFRKGDNYPVEQVSWHDVQKFLRKLNRKTKQNYRLPTEAEWEYAAKSGGRDEEWAGTNTEEKISDYLWYSHNSGDQTHPVGQKIPNGLGIYDMSGNVWEWCSDVYGYDYYAKSPRNNPQGPNSGNSRILRGSSWCDSPRILHIAKRRYYPPSFKYNYLGFRLAKTP